MTLVEKNESWKSSFGAGNLSKKKYARKQERKKVFTKKRNRNAISTKMEKKRLEIMWHILLFVNSRLRECSPGRLLVMILGSFPDNGIALSGGIPASN